MIEIESWDGPWDANDKDANLKADVALYLKVDPLKTIRGLSNSTNIPQGALIHYVLARWASEGAGGLLEIGPTLTRRMDAYNNLRQIISWLTYPLDHPEVYE
jgi:hypothetical protein